MCSYCCLLPIHARARTGNPNLAMSIAALLAIDRAVFAPRALPCVYAEQGLDLGFTVMSAPSVHVKAAAILAPVLQKVGGKALDVGAGSGYLSAIFALLVAAEGGADSVVVAMERSAELGELAASAARQALAHCGAPDCVAELIVSTAGDGHSGCAAHAPFDAIYVGAACTVVPELLVAQLAPGGRLLLAVGKPRTPQRLTLVQKSLDGNSVEHTIIASGLIMASLKNNVNSN